ncbi:hypothetical protein FQN54_004352 [Arachnomyces sp. PD_36]|nr:hypothetical protein FQN54_004352 [Arachnomyces sp. PD_36]
MSTPTLINLPPPPSDPVTPSDMGPGTPNSGTTSLSALSTTAIKDGHQGHRHPHHSSSHNHRSSTSSTNSTTTLDAERADRISRLAGLKRVATARSGSQYQHSPHSSLSQYPPSYSHPAPYFDNNGNPISAALLRERSTVGSASATGSNAGRTTTSTWASGASDDIFDSADKMSEMMDDEGLDASSMGGLSDEGNASLVGFGEGAGSTLSGPVSTLRGARMGSPAMSKTSASAVIAAATAPQTGSPMRDVARSSPSPAGSNTPEPVTDARMMDGMTYDANVVDTTVRTPQSVEETAEDVPERKT